MTPAERVKNLRPIVDYIENFLNKNQNANFDEHQVLFNEIKNESRDILSEFKMALRDAESIDWREESLEQLREDARYLWNRSYDAPDGFLDILSGKMTRYDWEKRARRKESKISDLEYEVRKINRKLDSYIEKYEDKTKEFKKTIVLFEQAYKEHLESLQKAKEEAMIKAAQEKAAAEKAEKERKLQEQIAAENAKKFSPDVVLVAGSFSAGKSEFINSLIESDFCLNTDISACTSVPTLITKANQLSFKAIKNNDEEIEISEQIFSTLHHSDNSGDEYKLIKISAPLKVNASFLDSPGYDAKSDMAHFLELAPRVSKAIWVIDIAAAATLKAQDLELLSQLNHAKLFVLLNKVDLFYEDIKSLLNFIDNQLKSANINALGIASYDSISCEEKEFLRMSINEFLA